MIDALNWIAMLLGYGMLMLLAIDASVALVRGFKRGWLKRSKSNSTNSIG